MAKVIEEKLGANAEEAAYRAQAFKPAEQAIEPIAADVAEMQSIAYGDLKFAIDTFEASLDESGKATSGVKAIPGISMSWYAAKDACQAARQAPLHGAGVVDGVPGRAGPRRRR